MSGVLFQFWRYRPINWYVPGGGHDKFPKCCGFSIPPPGGVLEELTCSKSGPIEGLKHYIAEYYFSFGQIRDLNSSFCRYEPGEYCRYCVFCITPCIYWVTSPSSYTGEWLSVYPPSWVHSAADWTNSAFSLRIAKFGKIFFP